MALIRWTPMLDSLDEMDRMFDDFMPLRNMRTYVPPVDVYQDKDNVIVEALLPGVDPKDVTVSVENDVLTVEGKTERKSEVDEKNYYRKEMRFGTYHRTVALPVSVNGDNASATFTHGMLKVVIPKEERVKPKRVAVKVVNG